MLRLKLDRPGFVARVPKGLGQAWPFVGDADAADETANLNRYVDVC